MPQLQKYGLTKHSKPFSRFYPTFDGISGALRPSVPHDMNMCNLTDMNVPPWIFLYHQVFSLSVGILQNSRKYVEKVSYFFSKGPCTSLHWLGAIYQDIGFSCVLWKFWKISPKIISWLLYVSGVYVGVIYLDTSGLHSITFTGLCQSTLSVRQSSALHNWIYQGR